MLRRTLLKAIVAAPLALALPQPKAKPLGQVGARFTNTGNLFYSSECKHDLEDTPCRYEYAKGVTVRECSYTFPQNEKATCTFSFA